MYKSVNKLYNLSVLCICYYNPSTVLSHLCNKLDINQTKIQKRNNKDHFNRLIFKRTIRRI